MPMHRTLLMVFIHFLWAIAESGFVAGNPTNDSFVNLSSTVRRSETTSIAENYSEPYDSSIVKADLDSSIDKNSNCEVQKSEERMVPQPWLRVMDLWRGWQMREWSNKQIHPTQAFDKLRVGGTGKWSIDPRRFKQWLQYIDMHRAQNLPFSDEEVVKLLIKRMYTQTSGEIGPLEKEARMKKLVRLIAWVRPSMKDRADHMLYLLFRSDPSDATSKLIMDVWLKKKLSPEAVWKILHLDGVHFVEALPAYPTLWLRYIARYNQQEKDEPYAFEEAVELLGQNMGLLYQPRSLFQEIEKYSELHTVAEQLKTYQRRGPYDLWRSKSTSHRKSYTHLRRSMSTSHYSRDHSRTWSQRFLRRNL